MSSDFDRRLQEAIQRGARRGEAKASAARAKALSEEELRGLHTQLRLRVSEHIESCVKRLPNYFPGFRYETMFGDRGWGAACSRDDLVLAPGGKRSNAYSRLEMTVRPYSNYHVLQLSAKGTIRNKETFNRDFYQRLEEVDEAEFLRLVDVWTLEYAEMYAAALKG